MDHQGTIFFWIISFIPLMWLLSIAITSVFGPLPKYLLYLRYIINAKYTYETPIVTGNYYAVTGYLQNTFNILQSPVTQTPCLWWRIVVREMRGRNVMTKLADHSEAAMAFLESGEIRAVVNVKKAVVRVPKAVFLGTGAKIDKQYDLPLLLGFFWKNKWMKQRWYNVKRVWIEEWHLTTNQEVTVYGKISQGTEALQIDTILHQPVIITTYSKARLIATLIGQSLGQIAIMSLAIVGIIVILRYAPQLIQ